MADILLDSNRELIIRNGDLVLGDGRPQRARIRLFSARGHLRHAPLVGEQIRLEQGGLASNVAGAIDQVCRAERLDPGQIVSDLA